MREAASRRRLRLTRRAARTVCALDTFSPAVGKRNAEGHSTGHPTARHIPELVAAKGLFITLLIVMSAVKFFTVVALYMHLKYDHRIFRAFFIGPFIVAAGTMMGLMFLFGKLAVRLGILN